MNNPSESFNKPIIEQLIVLIVHLTEEKTLLSVLLSEKELKKLQVSKDTLQYKLSRLIDKPGLDTF